MPGHVLSDCQKKMKVRNDVKEQLAKAVEVYCAELQKEPNV
jgi:hypothetical protein